MLLEFSVTNFLSFKDKNTFSMIASKDKEHDDNYVSVGNDNVLKSFKNSEAELLSS